MLVDGWGARHYLTRPLEQRLVEGGVDLLKYRPEVHPWHFRSHRMRRLHRKLCQVDNRVAFVGGINVIDDMNTPGHTPPRVDFAVRVRGPMLVPIIQTMQRVWAIVEIAQLRSSDVPLFPDEEPAESAGTQTAKFTIRDNLRHRRDIERAYLAGLRTARSEILIANRVLLPRRPLSPCVDQRGGARCARDTAAAGARRVSAAALRVAGLVRTVADGRRCDRGISSLVPACQGRRHRFALGNGRLVEHRSLFVPDVARGERVRPRPRVRRRAWRRASRDDGVGIAAGAPRGLGEPLALHQGGHVGRVRDRPRDDGVVAVWRRRVVALRLAPPLEQTAAASSCVVAPALEILMYVRVHSGFSRPRA